jgi:hypothetical protein
MEYKWLIASITLAALIIGMAFTFVSKPVYRADGLLQVEEKSSGVGSLKALQPLLGDDTTVSAEVEILGSRMVLGRVVEKLKLDIIATPKTFPLIGGELSLAAMGEEPNTPLLGLSSYAWGGEVIQVDSLDVPRPYLDQQLILRWVKQAPSPLPTRMMKKFSKAPSAPVPAATDSPSSSPRSRRGLTPVSADQTFGRIRNCFVAQ